MASAYVLDPDLAVKMVISESDPEGDYIIYDKEYRSVQQVLKSQDPEQLSHYLPEGLDKDITARNLNKSIIKLVTKEFFSQILPVLDLIKWNSPQPYSADKAYYVARLVISSGQYNILPPLWQQFYIEHMELMKSRYNVNDSYADLIIPPRGFYSKPVLETETRNVVARSNTSKVFKDSVRLLLRLRDGSLLELFDTNFNPGFATEYLKKLYIILDNLIFADPDLAKRYILAFCLDVSQNRPAYLISKLFQTKPF